MTQFSKRFYIHLP